MKINQHIHRQLRLKKLLSTLLLLIIMASLAWLSSRYKTAFDITSNAGNTLSSVSQNVLNSMTGSVVIQAYIKQDPALRAQIVQLIERYRQHKADLQLNFIDPAAQPDKIRELDIPSTGALFIKYQGHSQRINFLDESTLTNALLQLASVNEHWITFLSGHGERTPDGHANFDLGRFGEELTERAIKSQTLNLAQMPAIPDNSALLVIASPNVALLSGEMAIISDYIQRGGNLLWLTDPDSPDLPALEQVLGIKKLPGTLLNDNADLYGIDDPSFTLVSHYNAHPVTQKFQTLTLFPIAAALTEVESEANNFKKKALLKTSAKAWTEIGNLSQAQFDADSDEQDGPLNLAYTLTRTLNDDGNTKEQRIIVVGDGDFLANTFIGNVGNLDLGVRMINWLIHDDHFIAIPAKATHDKNLELTPIAVAVIGFGFLLVVPLALIVAGLMIWRKRKNR